MSQTQQGFFAMMKAEKATLLSIHYNRKENAFLLSMSREWSGKAKWAGKESSGLAKKPKTWSDEETQALVVEHRLQDTLNDITFIMRARKHEKLEFWCEANLEICCVIAFHHTSKKYTVGGIRNYPLAISEKDVITEALFLSHEMTFRCAAGEMPSGGVAFSVYAKKPKEEKMGVFFGFIAYLIERAEIFVAPEAGFSKSEFKEIRSLTSRCVGDDENSEWTIGEAAVYSIYLAMKEALAFRYGDDTLKNKTVGIQGLGQIGSTLAQLLMEEGADLFVSEIDESRLERFLESCPDRNRVTVIESTQIGMQMGHVFSPCSLESALTRDSIRYIDYHMIVGGANHLLEAETYQDELTIANRLMKKDILYVPGWISNMGGVKYGVSLVINEDKEGSIKEQIKNICGPLLKEIFKDSQEKGISPLEVAYQKFESSIYG